MGDFKFELNFDESKVRAVINGTQNGRRQGGKITLEKAVEKCPKDEGTLAASGILEELDNETSIIEFPEDYAIFVHEDLTAIHHNGEAKFLENALTETEQEILNIIAQEINKLL